MTDETLRAAYGMHMSGRLQEAARAYRGILDSEPRHLQALILFGVLRLQTEKFSEADALLARALDVDPNSLDALSLRAGALQQLHRQEDALALLDRLLRLNPRHAPSWNNKGGMLVELGRPQEAMASFEEAIRIDPGYAEAWHNRAAAQIACGNYVEAETDLRHAIELKPDYADALEHRGLARLRLGRVEQALDDYERFLRLRPQSSDGWHSRGNILFGLRKYPEALSSYNQALAIAPNSADVLNSRGGLLNHIQHHAAALADFDRALAIRPDDAAAWQGRANALARLNHEEEALSGYGQVLRLQPDNATALHNRASLLAQALRYEDARRDAEALLALDPDFPLARGLAMHIQLNICDWTDLPVRRADIAAAVQRGDRAIHPFGHLLISETAEEQRRCAEIAVKTAYPAATPLTRGNKYAHDKLRVAYLSGDFCDHAVAYLIAGVFEHHDKNRFDIFGISYGPDDGGETRQRIAAAFTRFIDVREMSDAAVASMLREMEIDIAVDLKGYTGGARPEVLAHRPAPIQVHYLGYPGTMGAGYIDYLIADRTVIPEADRASYAEQIVYLPDMYQSNDSQRRIAAQAPGRAGAGLPEGAFVFCCFNGAQKILPETFGLWMDVLRDVDGSVLWLFEDNALAVANLRREAEARGIAAERLIFAKRLPLDQHLARLQLADLVLDTLPYGAHTTASDALWTGVPVLTRIGNTFAGRVAASLLRAIGLPELITHSAAEFTSRAQELAQDAPQFANIKAKLADNRRTMPLFDTARITRNLEAAYLEMKARHDRGEPPCNFSVA